MWEPVSAGALGVTLAADRPAVESAAADQGLPPLRWPSVWPFDSELAMRAATFAKETGRVVAFSLAAMRQAFLAGRDLSVEDNILIAAAACELHPRAVLAALASSGVEERLRTATERAAARGVDTLPAFVVAGRVLRGPASIAAALEPS